MRRRTRAAIARWIAPVWVIAAGLCFWRCLKLALTVGDAEEAAKAGAPYTAQDWIAFHQMDRSAQHWFQGALACIVLCAACIFFAIYWNKRRRRRPREHRPYDPYRGLY